MHLYLLKLAPMCIFVWKSSTRHNRKMVWTVGWLGRTQPLTAKSVGMWGTIWLRAYTKRAKGLNHIVMVGNTHANGSITHIHMTRAPTWTVPHIKTIQIKIIFKRYSVKNHMGGVPVGKPFPKLYPCSEVAGSNPTNNINFKPLSRWHVAAIDWAMCRHPIHCKQAKSYANCPHDFLQCVIWPCHMS